MPDGSRTEEMSGRKTRLTDFANCAGCAGKIPPSGIAQLLGGLPAAIEQLRLARRAGTLDFYTGSQVDARLRELEADYLQERQDRKQMGGG